MTREKLNQYIRLKEEVEDKALEVYEIYHRIFYPQVVRRPDYWRVSSIEYWPGNKDREEELWVYMEDGDGDTECIPARYLLEENPEAKIRSDYEESQRLKVEELVRRRKEQEEHIEEVDRATYLRLMEKYKDKWNPDTGFST